MHEDADPIRSLALGSAQQKLPFKYEQFLLSNFISSAVVVLETEV